MTSFDSKGEGQRSAAQAQSVGCFDLQEDRVIFLFTCARECEEFEVDAVVVRHPLDDPAAAQDVAFYVVNAQIRDDVFARSALAAESCHRPIPRRGAVGLHQCEV